MTSHNPRPMSARKLYSLILLSCFASLPASLSAAENREQSLSLRDCIDLAVQYNLNLQIQRREPIISAYGIESTRWGYYDPQFSFGGSHNYSRSASTFNEELNLTIPGQENETDGFNSGLSGLLPYTGLQYSLDANVSETDTTGAANTSSRGGASITLSQPLLRNFWIDAGRRDLQIAKFNLESAELALNQEIMSIVTRVETAYYNLIFAYETVTVQEMALELAQRSLEENKKRVEVGALAPLEEKQTESQVAARKADLLAAQRDLATQQNILKRLITDNYASLHRVDLVPTETLDAPYLLLDVESSWDRGLNQRPDLLRAQIDIESQGIRLKYNRNQLFPQLDIFGTVGRGGSGIDYGDVFTDVRSAEEPNYRIGARITIPLSNKAARSRYRAEKERQDQLILLLKDLEQSIMAEIDDAVNLARTSYDRVDATREAREYAEAALAAEQKKLENGKSTSFIVLQLQNDLTSARSAEIRARADYNNALADLALREGATLERHNIIVDVR